MRSLPGEISKNAIHSQEISKYNEISQMGMVEGAVNSFNWTCV